MARLTAAAAIGSCVASFAALAAVAEAFPPAAGAGTADAQVDAGLDAWRLPRPDAPAGDAAGDVARSDAAPRADAGRTDARPPLDPLAALGRCWPPRPPRLWPALAPPDLAACRADGECVLVIATCCAGCGAVAPQLVRAVNARWAGVFRARVCGAGTACPACVPQADPALHAVCVGGGCRVRDEGHDEVCPPP